MKGVTPELVRCPEGSDPWAAVQRRAGCICSRSSGCTSTSCNVQALVENRTDVRVESNVQYNARQEYVVNPSFTHSSNKISIQLPLRKMYYKKASELHKVVTSVGKVMH